MIPCKCHVSNLKRYDFCQLKPSDENASVMEKRSNSISSSVAHRTQRSTESETTHTPRLPINSSHSRHITRAHSTPNQLPHQPSHTYHTHTHACTHTLSPHAHTQTYALIKHIESHSPLILKIMNSRKSKLILCKNS